MTHEVLSSRPIDQSLHRLIFDPFRDGFVQEVDYHTVRFLDVDNTKCSFPDPDRAMISGLSSALGVEACLVKHETDIPYIRDRLGCQTGLVRCFIVHYLNSCEYIIYSGE